MLLIRADHPHHAAAADDLALVTNPFDRRSYFHKTFSRQLLQFFNNPSSAGVDWRKLDPDAVAYEHSHEISIDSVGDVRHDPRSGVEAHPIECAGQLGDHGAGFRHYSIRVGPAVRGLTLGL